jgi:hypothetical protein
MLPSFPGVSMRYVLAATAILFKLAMFGHVLVAFATLL